MKREVSTMHCFRNFTPHLPIYLILMACVPVSLWGQEAGTAIEPVRVPQTIEAIQELENSLTTEILSINTDPQVGPFEDGKEPTAEEADRITAGQELREELKSFVNLLKEIRNVRTVIAEMESVEGTKRRTDDRAALAEKIVQVKARTPSRPRTVSDDDINKVKQELEAAQTDMNARIDRQRERRERLNLAEGRKELATKQVQETHSALIDALAKYSGQRSSDPSKGMGLADYALRFAQIKASRALGELDRIDLEVQRDTKHTALADQRIPLDKEYASALQAEFDRLKEFKDQTEVESIRSNLIYVKGEATTTKFEKDFWEYKLAAVEGLQAVRELVNQYDIQSRFTKDEFDELMEDLTAREVRWEKFTESLKRRPVDQIRERYLQVSRRIPLMQEDLEKRRKTADQTFDERSRVLSKSDTVGRDVRMKLRQLREHIRNNPNDESALARVPELAEQDDKFSKELAGIEEQLNAVVDRLDETVSRIDRHIVTLAALRSKIYIAYLGVRDRQPWKFSPSKSLEEWNSQKYVDVRKLSREEVTKAASTVTTPEWIVMGVSLLGTFVISIVGRIKLSQYARQLEAAATERLQQSEGASVPVSDRFHIQAADFLASTAIVTWPGLAALGCIRFSALDGRFIGTISLMIVIAGVLWGLIGKLFSQSKPRFRLLRCSNVIARYYRRWLRAMFIVSCIFAPVPILLYVLDWSYYTMSYLITFYKIIMLAIVLIFVARKQMVMKVMGRPEELAHPWIFGLISFFYPFGYLALAALFVCTVLGYGPLSSYLIIGVSKTAATILLAVFAWQYSKELVLKFMRKIRDSMDAADGSESAEENQGEQSGRAGERSPPLEEVWISFAFQILRWAYTLGVVVLMLSFWGLTPVELRALMDIAIIGEGSDGRPPITVERALTAIIIVMVSWMLARTLRAALQVKVDQSLSSEDRGGWIAIGTLAQYVIVLFGLYFALYVMRIPLGALTVILGTLGLGLGLGLQPLFANFFSGLVILFERHVKVGDIVVLDNGTQGQVTGISIRATTIKTGDNIDIVIPNGEFISGRVTNWTLDDTKIRARLSVTVAYGVDPRVVERLLLQVAYESPHVLADPAPEVRFTEFAASGMEFALYAWCRNAGDRWNFLTNSRYRILDLFTKNHVEIPQSSLTTSDEKPIKIELKGLPHPADVIDRLEPRERPKPFRSQAPSA